RGRPAGDRGRPPARLRHRPLRPRDRHRPQRRGRQGPARAEVDAGAAGLRNRGSPPPRRADGAGAVALDAAPTSVMVAGPDHAIVYANPAARAMLAAAADDVRASCPGVDPGALERSALHALDPDPAARRSLLD